MSSSNWVRPLLINGAEGERRSPIRGLHSVHQIPDKDSGAQTTRKRGITLAIVTHNEERFIKPMLELHRPYVDEIVLVDTGSTDSTTLIADALGARTVSRPHATFEEARNESLSLATRSHILILDPDEYIHPNDIRLLRSLTFGTHGAYRIPINTYLGKGEWASLPTLRLVANDSRIRFRGSHHPELGQSVRDSGLSIGQTHGNIHHFEILAVDKSKAKRLRNIRNAERDAAVGLSDPRTLTLRSLDHFSLGEWQIADSLCRKALQMRPGFERAHRFLGEMALLRREYSSALHHFAEAIQCATHDATDRTSLMEQSLMGKARAYWELGDLSRCEDSVHKGLDVRESSHGWLNLAIIANTRKQKQLFRRFAMRAATFNPFLAWSGIHSKGHEYSMYQQSSVVLRDQTWRRSLEAISWLEGARAGELYRREPMGA